MIVLQILKIIGIVLACVVGFVLLIVLLVMCAPLRYKLYGDGEGSDITAGACVRWLRGLLTVKIEYAEKKISYYVRGAGIKFVKGELDLGNIKKSDNKPETAEAEGLKEEPKPEEAEAAKEEFPGKEEPDEEEGRLSALVRKVTEKVKNLWEKIKTIKEKVETVKYIIGAPVTARAWALLKSQLFKLLNHIRPRKLNGTLEFGMEDPATTAQIYGAASSICVMMNQDFIIIPNMENKIIKMNLEIKGRIFIGYVLLLGLKILTSTDVRRVVKYVRRNLL